MNKDELYYQLRIRELVIPYTHIENIYLPFSIVKSLENTVFEDIRLNGFVIYTSLKNESNGLAYTFID